MRRLQTALMTLLLTTTLAGCLHLPHPVDTPYEEPAAAAGSIEQPALSGGSSSATSAAQPSSGPEPSASAAPTAVPNFDGWFYDLEGVVLYLDAYGELPGNYVSKSEARGYGWEGGVPSVVFDGAAIGGDRFGNYEGLLPDLPRGSEYRECDLDTDGSRSRGAHRLIYTDDGDPSDGCAPYYYTEDHYESFVEVEVVDGEVIIDE